MVGASQIASAHFRALNKHVDGGKDFSLGRFLHALDIHRGVENGYKEFGMNAPPAKTSYPVDSDDIYVSGHPPRNPGRAVKELQSRVISRAHARLLWRDSKLVILDQKSTHGTTVQSGKGAVQVLEPYREYQLRDGDEIIFGREVTKGAEVYQPPRYRVSFTYVKAISSPLDFGLSSTSATPAKAIAPPSKQASSVLSTSAQRRANLKRLATEPKPTSSTAIPFWSSSPIPLLSENEDENDVEEEEDAAQEDDDEEDEEGQVGCTYNASSQSATSDNHIVVVSDSECDDHMEESEYSSDEEPDRTINNQADPTARTRNKDGIAEGKKAEQSSDVPHHFIDQRLDSVARTSEAGVYAHSIGANRSDADACHRKVDGSDSEDTDEPTTPDLEGHCESTPLAACNKEATGSVAVAKELIVSAGSEVDYVAAEDSCRDHAITEEQASSPYTFVSMPLAKDTVVSDQAASLAEGSSGARSVEARSKKRSADEAGLEGAEGDSASASSTSPHIAVTPTTSNKRAKATFFSAGMATGFVAGIVGTVIGLSSFALSESF